MKVNYDLKNYDPKNEQSKVNQRKEHNIKEGYKVIDKDFNEIIDCRLYRANSSHQFSCAIWVRAKKSKITGNGFYVSGFGRTTGGNYHKTSFAVYKALNQAGFKFDNEFSGDQGIEEALLKVAQYVTGRKKLHITKFYG
jgi:hypothetical protein